MSVHYKFKSALDFDTITFDGLHISVADLKKAIIHQKRLGKTTDFDLQITNAQTKEEYVDDSSLIPKNTSLIIARIPLAVQQKKVWDPQNEKTQNIRNVPEPDSGSLDLSQMNGSEEDKIQAMMIQSTMDYDPNNYKKLRGQGQEGEVPANYRCFKCHKPGHWIKHCPLNVSNEMMDVKRNTGIPRSFIDRDQQENTEPQIQAPPPKVQEIPEDLICNICKDLFTDAVMIPCCGSSFCDECVRTALLESEDNECPDCKEKGCSPGSLIPNRFLRNSVNAFKNETGYNKPRPRRDPPKAKDVTSNTQQINNPVQNNQVVRTNSATTTPNETANSDNVEETKEDNEKDSSTKEEEKSKDIPEPEKKIDIPVAHLSHDETESDFEDNITVTVPPAHMQSQRSSYRERHFNEKAPWSSKSMMHMSPMGGNPISRSTSSPADRSMSPMMDANKDIPDQQQQQQQQQQKHHHGSSMHLSQRGDMPIRSHRAAPEQMYNAGPPPPVSAYAPTQPMMGPSRPYDHMSGYNVPHGHNFNPYMMGERVRGPYHPPRPGYPPVHHMRPRHVAPSNALASVYQGVAAKVGPGIIDDPLEAFNRIMREKEKRKEERRRSPERRRSRSVEQNFGRRPSPGPYTRFRNRSPEEWRQRSPPRERRGRSRERDRRSVEKDKRRQRSSSFSDRSSRSRSWSIPPRRRTKSPQISRRRTRSRSPSFNVNRFRPKEPRGRMERKEDFPREDFRDNRSSPYHYQGRRPRSRGRLLSPPPQFRQDRNNYNQDQYYNHPGSSYDEGGSGAGSYSHNNRYPRGGSPSKVVDMPSNRRGRNTGIAADNRNDYHNERYDEALLPPGSDEPPPPGYENSPPSSQYERRNSNNYNKFGDDHQMYMKDNYRKSDNFNDKNLLSPSKSSQRDLPSTNYEMRRFENNGREREVRSWSRDSRRSGGFNPGGFDKKRKSRSRSRSPLWVAEKYPDHHPRERNPSRERYRPSAEHQHYGSGVEFDRKKDKLEKDKKPSDKREPTDRKSHEKENRFVNKEDKDHDRQTSRQSDKERKRDSSDDDKKDKKSKEKRKKKKEDKKKNKRDKKDKDRDKEKEKKEKDKNKEKQEIVNLNEFSIEKNITHENEETELTNILKPDTEVSHPENYDAGNNNTIRESNENEETSPTDKGKKEKKPGSEDVDLYGDICPEEDVKYDVPENIEETETYTEKLSPAERTTPTNIQRFDSFLDIHDYEPDLEEMTREGVIDNSGRKDQNVTLPMPELSKWERDEENLQGDERREVEGSNLSEEKLMSSGKVTIDVIKRAENAIFQRAINAIRPIEIKKISADRQKLYANEPSPPNKSIMSSPPGITAKDHHQSPPKEIPSFQITVATTNNSSERSVEATRDIHHVQQQEQHESKKSPVRSVKDRLGSKVSEPSGEEVKISSRKSSSSIVGTGDWNREKSRRSRSKDRHREAGADHREPRRGSEIKRPHEPFRQRDRNNSPRDRRFMNENMGKFRDQIRARKEEFSNKDKVWMRDRDRDRDRERPRDVGNIRGMNRGGRDNKFPARSSERDFARGRDRGYNQPHRFKEGIQSQYGFNKEEDKSRETNKNRDKEKNKYRSEKRERSRSISADRRINEKRPRLVERDNREKIMDEKHKSTDAMKTDKEEHKKKSNNSEQQEYHRKLDEANFIPDYDEPTGHQENYQQQHKEDMNMKKLEENTRNGNNKDNQEKTKDLKIKLPESKKRSTSKSADSSSSSSSSSSDSESEEKRKKKRKHKKEKKKSRRASSGESSSSVKHKRSKSKKKSKSSKKKKKNKK